MKSKNNNKLIVILIIALAIGFFYYNSLGVDGSGLKVHYYKDGVEVFQIDSLSVIQVDTSSYDEISFEIIGENTGDYPITNMLVDSAEPIEFKDSLPTLSKSLAVGETKTLWISDRIDVHQFESLSQPIKFWVNISGESPYVSGKIYDYIELEMEFGTIEGAYTGESWSAVISNIYGFGNLGITIQADKLFLNIRMGEVVREYNLNTGAYIKQWSLRSVSSDNMANVYDLSSYGGYVYALDHNWNRICKYDSLGNHKGCFSAGASNSMALSAYNNNFFIFDYYSVMHKLGINGEYLGSIRDVSRSANPQGSTSDGEYIWVVIGNTVMRLDSNGILQNSWSPGIGTIIGIAQSGDFIYLATESGTKPTEILTIYKYNK